MEMSLPHSVWKQLSTQGVAIKGWMVNCQHLWLSEMDKQISLFLYFQISYDCFLKYRSTDIYMLNII